MIKKYLAILGAVFGLTLIPTSAHASGFWQDGYSSSCQQVYSTYSGGYINVCFDVTGYYDGSNRYYRVSSWSTDGSSGTFSLTVRYWVCGTFYGSVQSSGSNGNWYEVYSGTYTYGSCGHQADDWYSSATSVYWSANPSQYVSI